MIACASTLQVHFIVLFTILRKLTKTHIALMYSCVASDLLMFRLTEDEIGRQAFANHIILVPR